MQSTKSDFNVEVIRVTDIRPHPNADRLELVYVYGTIPSAVKKGDFKVGDLAVFIPQDAIVPLSNPVFSFLKRHEGQAEARVKAVKLRGMYSEGLVVPTQAIMYSWLQNNAAPSLFISHSGNEPDTFSEGSNVQEILGIRKWLSPADLREMKSAPARTGAKSNRMKYRDPGHMPIYGLDSAKRFPDIIKPGTEVILTEKIHGCNARYSYLDGRLYVGSHKVMRGATNHRFLEYCRRLWPKFTNLFRKTQAEPVGDIWWEVAEKYNLAERLSKYPGYVFYGEIYGQGVQKRGGVEFLYDSPSTRSFRVFDIYDSEKKEFLSFWEMGDICTNLNLAVAPWLGIYDFGSVEGTAWYASGNTLLGRNLHIREGVVIRTDIDKRDKNRVVLKLVSDEYKMLGDD
jgi:RNA ligase (TIGR02306 family)